MEIVFILLLFLIYCAVRDSIAKRKLEKERDINIQNLLTRMEAVESRLKCLEIQAESQANMQPEKIQSENTESESENLQFESPARTELHEAEPVTPWYVTSSNFTNIQDYQEHNKPTNNTLVSKIHSYAQKGVLWLGIGAVILTAGVGFLIQYAWDYASVAVPASYAAGYIAEARFIAAGFIAVALLSAGWCFREKRRVHALILQGTGIGLFYMTIFSASAVSGLLAVPYAFALTALTIVCAGVLALKQDSEALAWTASAIGFAAPALTGAEAASGTVSHIWFFSYYFLLNLGIFAAARFRSWRGLCLLGFLCTYTVMAGWCIFDYPLNTFSSVKPFFVIFLLGYTWVAVRMVLRGDFSLDRAADAVLLAGTPAAFCSLQFPLAWHIDDQAAFTAYALGLFYFALGYFLYRRRRDITVGLQWTIKASLWFGIALVNAAAALSLPLDVIALALLLLGMAVVLAGLKMESVKVRAAGAALHLAGTAILFAGVYGLLPSICIRLTPAAAAMISAASAFACCLTASMALRGGRLDKSPADSWEMRVLLFWAICCAYGVLIDWAFFSGVFSFPFYVLLAIFSLAGVFFIAFGQRTGANAIQMPALFPALLALYLFASAVFEGNGPFPLTEFLYFRGGHPLAEMGILAWPIFFAGQFITLTLLERGLAKNTTANGEWSAVFSYLHGGSFVLFIMILAEEIGYVLSISFNEFNLYWIDLIIVMFLVLTVNAAVRFKNYRRSLGAGCGILCITLWLWAAASLLLPGDSSPLAYMPLFNPLSFAELAIFITVTFWHVRTAHLYPEFEAWITARVSIAVCVVLTMAWSTAEAARIFHFYGGLPFTMPALWNNLVFQTAITLIWGLWSLGMMRFGSKKAEHRRIWNIGALLLFCDVCKLIFADLSGTGTLTRILSFVGLGFLLILVGWLAPLSAKGD